MTDQETMVMGSEMGRNRTSKAYECSFFERLPIELVAKIFLHVTAIAPHPFQMTEKELHKLKATSSPRLLSSICRLFRAIAFSTSQLWENIWLRFRQPLASGYELELLRQWLDRSQARPLSLNIIRPIYEELDEFSAEAANLQDTLDKMTEIIASVLPRCRVMYMGNNQSKGAFHFDKLMQVFPRGMPELKTFYITSDSEVSDQIDFRACTRLQVLADVHMIYSFSRSLFTPLQIQSLRCLKTAGGISEFAYILRHCTSLTDCFYDIRYLEDPAMVDLRPPTGGEPIEPIIAQHLQSLEIGGTYPLDMEQTPFLWDLLTLPSLQMLSTKLTGPTQAHPDGPTCWSSLCACLRRSRPALEILTLQSWVHLHERELISILSTIPTLTQLYLHTVVEDTTPEHPITSRFWQSLRGEGAHDSDVTLNAIQSNAKQLNEDIAIGSDLLPSTSASSTILFPRLKVMTLRLRQEQTHFLTDIAPLLLFHLPPIIDGKPASANGPASGGPNISCFDAMIIGNCGFTKSELEEYPPLKPYLDAGLLVDMGKDPFYGMMLVIFGMKMLRSDLV